MDKINIPPDISPSPWKFSQGGSPGWRVTDKNNELVCFSKDNPYTAPNAEFIVYIRNNIDDILYENIKLRSQQHRVETQTRHIRRIYALLLEIEHWLQETGQPDTYIDDFKKLVDESRIFRESAL